jgi:putative transposase
VIFQLQDDHSRLALATHVAAGETAQDALAVMKKGIAVHGVPQRLRPATAADRQRLLTDNGC